MKYLSLYLMLTMQVVYALMHSVLAAASAAAAAAGAAAAGAASITCSPTLPAKLLPNAVQESSQLEAWDQYAMGQSGNGAAAHPTQFGMTLGTEDQES